MQADLYCDQSANDDYISQIIINPSLKSENYTRGLCDKWTNKNEQDVAIKSSEFETFENYIKSNRYLF